MCFDKSKTSASVYTGKLRRLLMWLWQEHSAEKLDGYMEKAGGIRPRNIVWTPEEFELVYNRASDDLKLMMLLCADLGIRSGTAYKLNTHNYDHERKTLRFKTKMQEGVTLPVTEAIAEMLRKCDLHSDLSFVRQLQSLQRLGRKIDPNNKQHALTMREKLKRRLKACGITRRLTFHDMRRTTAVAMYEATGDVRDVQALLGHTSMQSTIWYLDHDLRPVNVEVLEQIKRRQTA